MLVRRIALRIMISLALIPSSTAWNYIWYAGRPDDDAGAYPRVLPQEFIYDQRHHKCALIVKRKVSRYGVESYLCEFPSPPPDGIPMPAGDGKV